MPIATGTLKLGTPFSHVFPDYIVPLVSPLACRPGEGLPMSVIVDGEMLDDIQIACLCHVWMQQHPSASYQDAYEVVRLHYPLKETFFHKIQGNL